MGGLPIQLLKRERIRRTAYLTRGAARQDVFDCFEMFCTPTRKHTTNKMLSPVDHETRPSKPNQAGVWQTGGTSSRSVPDGDLRHPMLRTLQLFSGHSAG